MSIYIDDVVAANLRTLEETGNGVFNIGSARARTVREVFAAVAAAAGFRGRPVFADSRPGDVRVSCLDVSRARRVLGWTARMPFAEGIDRTLRAMRDPVGSADGARFPLLRTRAANLPGMAGRAG